MDKYRLMFYWTVVLAVAIPAGLLAYATWDSREQALHGPTGNPWAEASFLLLTVVLTMCVALPIGITFWRKGFRGDRYSMTILIAGIALILWPLIAFVVLSAREHKIIAEHKVSQTAR
jgi:high-affinity Fe2+/Pb2+ permease